MSKISERERARRRTRAARDTTLRNRERLLLTRRDVAALFGVSIETIIRIENEGRLTPLKLTTKPNGMTFYRSGQVHELAGEAV